jgi:hypothetical protein
MNTGEMESFEYVRHTAVQKAVQAADRVIIDACGGNPETLMLLTTDVTQEFLKKVGMMVQTETYKKQILCEVEPNLVMPGASVDSK